jgi:hypothetical protein
MIMLDIPLITLASWLHELPEGQSDTIVSIPTASLNNQLDKQLRSILKNEGKSWTELYKYVYTSKTKSKKSNAIPVTGFGGL